MKDIIFERSEFPEKIDLELLKQETGFGCSMSEAGEVRRKMRTVDGLQIEITEAFPRSLTIHTDFPEDEKDTPRILELAAKVRAHAPTKSGKDRDDKKIKDRDFTDFSHKFTQLLQTEEFRQLLKDALK